MLNTFSVPLTISVSLCHPKLHNITNPFELIELISFQGKTNFFEKRALSGVGTNETKHEFDLETSL